MTRTKFLFVKITEKCMCALEQRAAWNRIIRMEEASARLFIEKSMMQKIL